MVMWGLIHRFTAAEPHLHSQEGPGKICESLTLVSVLAWERGEACTVVVTPTRLADCVHVDVQVWTLRGMGKGVQASDLGDQADECHFPRYHLNTIAGWGTGLRSGSQMILGSQGEVRRGQRDVLMCFMLQEAGTASGAARIQAGR